MEVSSPLEGRALRELGLLLREERARTVGLKRTFVRAARAAPEHREVALATNGTLAIARSEDQASYGYDAW
jgi:hypothetical protein